MAVPDGGVEAEVPDEGPDVPTSVPEDAVGVDVACPHCGRNPIESVAKGYRVTGLLLVSRHRTFRVVGCQSCIRRKLLATAARNLFLGWWGVFALVANLFAIPWNVGRAFVSRGPNQHLVDTLADTGIPFEFVREGEEWTAGDHEAMERSIDGMVQLACAAMAADGEPSEAQRAALVDVAGQLFEDHSEAEVRATIGAYEADAVDVEAVSRGLAPLLTDEGKQLALNVVATVAGADGDLAEPEAALVAEVAEGLDVSERQLEELAGA